MAFDIQKKLAAILEGYPAIWNSTLGGKNGKGTSNRDAAMHQRKQVAGLLNISEEQVKGTYETLRKNSREVSTYLFYLFCCLILLHCIFVYFCSHASVLVYFCSVQ